MAKHIAIVGGGLAGLTAAKGLVDQGHKVEVFEALPYLGGRASTYRDETGRWIEQGLHIFLGTYAEFKKLLEDIGRPVDSTLFWMDQIQFRDVKGPQAVYGINPLRSPLKSLLTLAGQNKFLGLIDKLAMIPLAGQGIRSFEGLRKGFDDMTVTELWKREGATEDVLERFLRPFCRAIQFTDAEDFSAFNFLGWIHHSLYDLPHALAGGYKGARDESIFRPLARYLEIRGTQIHMSTELEHIAYSETSQQIESLSFKDGRTVRADAYIMALPSWILTPLLPPALLAQPFFQNIATLPTAPAIAVQLWFDRPVSSTTDFKLVAGCVLPVYQEQAITYGDPHGTRLSTTISPADDYLDLSDEELVRLNLDLLAQVQPEVKNAKLVHSKVLKHKHHLVRPYPGVMSRRPSQLTPVANLYLAGDWTQQDYFGSQEGAVRSGNLCAQVLLEALKTSGRSAKAQDPEASAPL